MARIANRPGSAGTFSESVVAIAYPGYSPKSLENLIYNL